MNKSQIAAFAAVLGLVLTAGVAAAAPGGGAQQITVPFTTSVFNPCVGEEYDLTGNLHLKVQETANANTEHFDFTLNTNDVKLTDQDGDDASCTGQASFHFSLNAGTNSAMTVTDKDQIKLQCQGGASLSLFDLDHITVNADGTATASVDNFSLSGSCN